MEILETDYLVIGAGGTGMAFVDEIIARSPRATVVLLDRRDAPGGHWNVAYDFVRLHQPAAYYGVNSACLESHGKSLSSKPKILSYFKGVLNTLVSTGRVRFFPNSNYLGDRRFQTLDSPQRTYEVRVRKKIVDATYMNITVPLMRPPPYQVDDGMQVEPINALADLDDRWERFVVVGAGKTGMDAVLELLRVGVEPDRVRWVIPNDAWFLDRGNFSPVRIARDMPLVMKLLIEARNPHDALNLFEASGQLLRLDTNIRPTMYRCATVNREELTQLRRITDVIRLGRVERISKNGIELERGTVGTDARTLHVDCTANGLVRRPPKTVFDGKLITIQPIFYCQPLFSAALIGLAETFDKPDAFKNLLCRPIAYPDVPYDMFPMLRVSIENMREWGRDFGRVRTLTNMRLCFFHHFPFLELVRHVAHSLWLRSRTLEKLKAFEDDHIRPGGVER